MKKLTSLLVATVLLGVGCQNPNGGFNPALVEAKQKCQEEFLKLQNAEQGPDSYIRAHFNPNLNTCLVEYGYQSSDGTENNFKILDIYNSNKQLLEIDTRKNGPSLTSWTATLWDTNGQVNVPSADAFKEYNKRVAVFFEEAPPKN